MKKTTRRFWIILLAVALLLSAWIIRYKAINKDYQQRWSANTEKAFNLGETVPIETDFVGYNQRADGYMLEVTNFEIVDYSTYTSALSCSDTAQSRIPDKLGLVYITVSQQDSSAEGLALDGFSLYMIDMLFYMDWDLLGVINPILDGYTGIRLQDGASCNIVLPFDIYRYRFSAFEWNVLEQSNIWLKVTSYPTRKSIQVNTGD